MNHMDNPIQKLIGIKYQERTAARAARLWEMVGLVETQLGVRVMEALNPAGNLGWEFQEGLASRPFSFAGDGFTLTVHGPSEVSKVAQVEMRMVAKDIRDEDCRKRSDIGEVNEDWFVDVLQYLCTEAGSIRKR